MKFARYMTDGDFLRELGSLRAYLREYVGRGLLDSLEAAQLLYPKVRISFPDPVARRFWLLRHDEQPRQMRHQIEPDGQRWEAAKDFEEALYRWNNWMAYGHSANPLDDPEPRFRQFIETPSKNSYISRLDRRVDVSNDIEETLFDEINFDHRYSTWQLLFAAEQADAGVHIRTNIGEVDRLQIVQEAIRERRLPEDLGYSFNGIPINVAREYALHQNAMDAVVWFAEERNRALSYIIRNQAGRFRLSPDQNEQYQSATLKLAHESAARYVITADKLIGLFRFFAERWSEWNGNGRPIIAEAYKEFLGLCGHLARRIGPLSFAELRDSIGKVGGWNAPILDVIWPDWTKREKNRVSSTLRSEFAKKTGDIIQDDIDAFVDFLSAEGLEAFFWRLKSFEEHALRGNDFAVPGMKSDIQGMAVVVEHIAAKLGATEEQLFDKFKQLWRNTEVESILKRGDVAQLARQKRLLAEWPALKLRIGALRSETGGDVAADLVMAHRIRGGVHNILPEDDQFELEALLIGLMRAALVSFIKTRRRPLPPQA